MLNTASVLPTPSSEYPARYAQNRAEVASLNAHANWSRNSFGRASYWEQLPKA
jgi:hypothetical protein